MDVRALASRVQRIEAAEEAIRTHDHAALSQASRELAALEERIRRSEAIGDFRREIVRRPHAGSTPSLSPPPVYEGRGPQQQQQVGAAAEVQIPEPQASPSRNPGLHGLAFVEPLIFASSGWKTASIYRDQATGRLQTRKSLMSAMCTRTKQLKIMRITEDVTSYQKLKERALQVLCVQVPTIRRALPGEENTRAVTVQDLQVIWTGGEGQSEDTDEGNWFTSLKGLADEEVSLCLEKMEEREWKDRLAVVFRLSEDS
ncbi:hypothetical protein IFR05_009360 [Cadophora sp. M221]|nr:hypothetical protein IFR05_009360 [Cadophora sp. M221]